MDQNINALMNSSRQVLFDSFIAYPIKNEEEASIVALPVKSFVREFEISLIIRIGMYFRCDVIEYVIRKEHQIMYPVKAC